MRALADPWSRFRAALAEDPEGVRAVLEAGDRLGLEPRELAWVITRESGWDPAARNPVSDALGLIQFMPSTRAKLGAPDPFPVTRAEQAPWIEAFFRAVGRRVRPGDVYLAVAAPAFVGKPDETVVYEVGSEAWKLNPSLRSAGDGPITAGSIRLLGRPPGASLWARPGVSGLPGWFWLLVLWGASRAL